MATIKLTSSAKEAVEKAFTDLLEQTPNTGRYGGATGLLAMLNEIGGPRDVIEHLIDTFVGLPWQGFQCRGCGDVILHSMHKIAGYEINPDTGKPYYYNTEGCLYKVEGIIDIPVDQIIVIL